MATAVAAVPVGVGFTPFEDRVDVIDRVAVHAESRGLAFVSVAEAMSLAAPIVLARLAERTHRIGLMTGVLSVWSRTPATLAMTAAELQRHSAGRFVLGLGAGTQPTTEGFHGEPWKTPLDRVQQTCLAVRALLRGERLPDAPDGARPLRLGSPARDAGSHRPGRHNRAEHSPCRRCRRPMDPVPAPRGCARRRPRADRRNRG